MGRLLDIVTPLHKATKRDYLARMNDDKVHCMLKAQGIRVRLLGRRPPLRLRRLQVHRGPLEAGGAGADRHLRPQGRLEGARRRLRQGLPALRDEEDPARPRDRRLRHLAARPGGRAARRSSRILFRYRAQDRYPLRRQALRPRDLARHLPQPARSSSCETAVQEIERVGKNKYIMVEGYRNELEQFNLECWALTAESILAHRRNGSGSTTTSAIPATTSSSISNERTRMKIKTAKAAILAQSRKPLIVDEITLPDALERRPGAGARFCTPRSAARRSTRSRPPRARTSSCRICSATRPPATVRRDRARA